jgi:hypothetical protein
MAEKVLLDAFTASVVHKVSIMENRSRSNAANRLIREAWAQRQNTAQTSAANEKVPA